MFCKFGNGQVFYEADPEKILKENRGETRMSLKLIYYNLNREVKSTFKRTQNTEMNFNLLTGCS